MARMSVDDSALRDPRMRRLAKAVGWSRRETIGALLDVWALCYDRMTPVIPGPDVDATAELDGFAASMETVGLARELPEGFRIAGATERIEYLLKCKEWGSRGGQASAANRAAANETGGRVKPPSSQGQGTLNHSPDPVPDPPPDPVPDTQNPIRRNAGGPAVPTPHRKGRKPRGTLLQGITEERRGIVLRVLERLSARGQTTYQGADAHVRLICARLDEGYTEFDLRAVVGYCGSPTGMNFAGKEATVKYMRPETLFGPETIQRYIEAARQWAKRSGVRLAASPEASQAAPGAPIATSAPPSPALALVPEPEATQEDGGTMFDFAAGGEP